MKSTENEAVRISGNMARGVMSALETFVKVMSKKEFKNATLKEASKQMSEFVEGIAYDNIEDFYSAQVEQGINQFDSFGANFEENEMSLFNQLAKQYGLKYAYERKPDNIQDLLQKDNLSESEQMTLHMWTKVINDQRREVSEDFKITFACRDIPKVESIVKEILKHPNVNLDERTYRAQERRRNYEADQSVHRDRSAEMPDYGSR